MTGAVHAVKPQEGVGVGSMRVVVMQVGGLLLKKLQGKWWLCMGLITAVLIPLYVAGHEHRLASRICTGRRLSAKLSVARTAWPWGGGRP